MAEEKRTARGFHRTPAERAAREEELVRDLAFGRGIAFGRLMQLVVQMWQEHLDKEGYPRGGEFTIGPCAALLVPCQCRAPNPALDANGHCEWCEGVGAVTKRVRGAQHPSRFALMELDAQVPR